MTDTVSGIARSPVRRETLGARRTPVQGALSVDRNAVVLSALDDIPLPHGCELQTETEVAMWRDYTKARTPADWLPHDLWALHKLVVLDAKILDAWDAIGDVYTITTGQFGNVVTNPALTAVINMERLSSMQRTKLGMAYDVRAALAVHSAGRHQRAQHARTIVTDADDQSLLAGPST